MMHKGIKRNSPEQIFVSVRNRETSDSMSTGHAVFYQYLTGTTGNGYDVIFKRDTATQLHNPGLFAGIVAGRDILAGEWGSIQVYGHTDRVWLCGLQNLPFTGADVALTEGVLTNRVLRPVGAFTTVTGTTYDGMLGMIIQASSINVATDTFATALAGLWAGGYVIPVDAVYRAGSTTYGTLTTSTSTGTCKAFIHCL